MADPHIPPEGWSIVFWLMGGGSVGGIAIALIGKVRGAPPPSPPPPARIEVETPWMVQNLLEMKVEAHDTHELLKTVPPLLSAMSGQIAALTTQLSAVTALLKRRQNRRTK